MIDSFNFVLVPTWRFIAFVFAASAALTATLIWLLMPLMRRYAMARPTARGLHVTPTPQGGGLAIMLAIVPVGGALPVMAVLPFPPVTATLLLAASAMAALGAVDDILNLGAGPRLVAQFLAAGAVVCMAPLFLGMPVAFCALFSWINGFSWIAVGVFAVFLAGIALATVGLVWFVNLTNFMDGMDGMTVVGLGVPALFAALANLAGHGVPSVGIFCLAAVGGLLGFFPFNAPRARLFLGDVGSLSLGLIVGTALLCLALADRPVPALIAPLYYLCDATITLFLRWRRGETLSQAHRTHFYQRAVTGGMSAWGVLARVGALNVALAGLATAALAMTSLPAQFAALALAAALVALTLHRLGRGASGGVSAAR